jgi:lysophospholipase L1-like esterase
MAMVTIKNWMKLAVAVTITGITTMEVSAQKLAKNEPVKFLALGDSYTIGESVAEVQRWPVQLVNALMLNGYTCHQPEIVAVTGWTTDDLKKAIQERNLPNDFNLVSLLIGVNNQYQGKSISEYKAQFEELLKLAMRYCGGTKSEVIILSIPDYGYTPFGKEKQAEISDQINVFNEVNRAVAKQHGVTYINITDSSRRGLEDPELIAEDGLHPSGKMYALWVQKILEVLR